MPQQVQDPRRHQGAGFQIQLQQALLTLHPKSVSLWWALILCCLLLVFSFGPSISLLVSCSVSCPSSHFCLDIYLSPPFSLQPQLTAVINGFDICLISSLPLSGSLKSSPLEYLPTSLPSGGCLAAEHALLNRTATLSTQNMK